MTLRFWSVLLGGIILGAVGFLSCWSDTTMPYVKIVAPANRDTLAPAVITIAAIATDNYALAAVECYVNARLLGTMTPSQTDTFRIDWHAESLALGSNHTIKARAIDSAGNDNTSTIYVTIGQPGARNRHAGRIREDQTWYLADSPHYIDEDVFVDNNAVLTIEPGCVVKFAAGTKLYCGFLSAGAIIAVGTQSAPITFTSAASAPSAGDWDLVGLYALSRASTELRWCVFEYGGSHGAQVYIDMAAARVSNCVIRHSASCGIVCSDNGWFATLRDNEITACQSYPLRLNCEYVRTIGAGNRFVGNHAGYDAIEVLGGQVITSSLWQNLAVPYIVNSTIVVGSSGTAPVLTIAPGTTVMCRTAVELRIGYVVPGGLIADGTTAPIVFTSACQPPLAGDWGGIFFYPASVDAQCRLRRCKIEYGGGTDTANVMILDARPEIALDSIGFSAAWGAYVTGFERPLADSLRANNWFYNYRYGDIGP